MENFTRRGFIEKGTIAAVGLSALSNSLKAENESPRVVRAGIIGTGNRGTSHLSNLLTIPGTEIVAVCDLDNSKCEHAADLCIKAGRKRPKIWSKDENTWKEMLDKEKLDCVIIATYWGSHAPIALYAMRNGIYPGIEVPATAPVGVKSYLLLP